MFLRVHIPFVPLAIGAFLSIGRREDRGHVGGVALNIAFAVVDEVGTANSR